MWNLLSLSTGNLCFLLMWKNTSKLWNFSVEHPHLWGLSGYAALILADEGLEITADKLQTLTKAAGIEVESIWSSLFAKALEGKDVKDLLLNVRGMKMISHTVLTLGSAGAAPAPAGGAAATGGAALAEENVEEKEEEKEESDEDVLPPCLTYLANLFR
jgi:large subunit ribosomal protein LP1